MINLISAVLQAKAKAKLIPTSTVVSQSSASVSTPSIPAIVTSAITTQALHAAGQGIHSIQAAAAAAAAAAANSSQQQQQQPHQQQGHNVAQQHLPILMDPLVPSNYLISI